MIVTLICQQIPALLDHNIKKSSTDFDIPLHFFLSSPVAYFKINQLPRELSINSSPSRFLTYHLKPCPSSPITFSGDTEAILLAACQLIEAVEKKDFKEAPVDLYLEEKDNDAFLNQYLSDNESLTKEKGYNNNENKWDNDNEDNNSQASPALWIDFGAIVKAKNKLIRILKGEVLIP